MRRASRALDSIYSYIAARDPRAADRIVENIEAAIERLSENPLIGHTRRDITDRHVRFWSVGNYMIMHRGRDPVIILDIIDARRNLARVLR